MINIINYLPKKLIFDGNSLFNLLGKASTPYVLNGFSVSSRVRSNNITGGKNAVIHDYSVQGKTTVQLTSDFPTKVQPYINKNDVLIFWELTNDLASGQTPAQCLTNLKAYCSLAKTYCKKVYILTCIPDDSGRYLDADRLTLNSLILADTSFCDGIIDICALPEFDALADASNTTYYQTDKLHLTLAGFNLVGDTIYNNSAVQSNF